MLQVSTTPTVVTPSTNAASRVLGKINTQLGVCANLAVSVEALLAEIAALSPPSKNGEDDEDYPARLADYQRRLNDLQSKLQEAQQKLTAAQNELQRLQTQELPRAAHEDAAAAERALAAIARQQKQLAELQRRARNAEDHLQWKANEALRLRQDTCWEVPLSPCGLPRDDPGTPDQSMEEMRAEFIAKYPEDGAEVFNRLYQQNSALTPEMIEHLSQGGSYEELMANVPAQMYRDLSVIDALRSPKTEEMASISWEVPELLGLARGAGDQEKVEVLQDALITLGYLPKSMMTGPGYGTFGSDTYDAVTVFQLDNGIACTGVVDEATIDALKDPRPRTLFRPASGLDEDVEDRQVGLATGAPQKLDDGSVYQACENGYVLISADGRRYVRDLDGNEIEPPLALAPASTVREADQYHLTQWGETEYFQNEDPETRIPHAGFNDCGPASAGIALIALGMLGRPSPEEVPELIDLMRDLTAGHDTNYSRTMGNPPVIDALTAMGAEAVDIGTEIDDLRAAVTAGHPVVIGSYSCPWSDDIENLNGGDPVGHFVTVVGMTPTGDFIVCDPLAADGPVIVSVADMEASLDQSWGMIEVSRP